MNRLAEAANADLPDDPRDCCRAILDALRAVDDYAIRTAPAAFARMSEAMLENDVDMADCADGLRILAGQAVAAAESYEEAVGAV